ncbi:MAG: helix-turn-helix transcriptional regulator [Sedimentibacter sp.]
MIIFSTAKLSKTIKAKREEKRLTQGQLSEITGIKSVVIYRIEREEFMPSITQLEALAKVLDFEITDMFLDKKEATSFIALRNQTLSDNEKEGIEKLFSMMLTLRQQILLRKKFYR